MIKSIVCALFLFKSVMALASDNTIAAVISINNQTNNTLERIGASFGCGPNNPLTSISDPAEQILCQYQGKPYYKVNLPDTTIPQKKSVQGSVLAYPSNPTSIGRLGLQYADPANPELGCGLIVDFIDNQISEIHIEPLNTDSSIQCSTEVSDQKIKIIIQQ